jgi:hypothetical protein
VDPFPYFFFIAIIKKIFTRMRSQRVKIFFLSKSFSKLAHGLIEAWFEKQQKNKISYACVPLTALIVESIWLINIGVEVITCILYVHHGIKKLWKTNRWITGKCFLNS